MIMRFKFTISFRDMRLRVNVNTSCIMGNEYDVIFFIHRSFFVYPNSCMQRDEVRCSYRRRLVAVFWAYLRDYAKVFEHKLKKFASSRYGKIHLSIFNGS